MVEISDPTFYQKHADLCRVFSNANRLKLLDILEDGEEYTVSELERASGISQSTISQHMRLMRDQGIVERRKEGVKSHYSITDERFVEGMRIMREMLEERDSL